MTYQVQVVDLPQQPAMVIRGHVAHDGIAAFLGQTFGEIMAVLQGQHALVTGAPFGRYQAADDGGWRVEAGFPVENTPEPEGRTQLTSLPGGPVARTVHLGDYGALGNAYQAVQNWLTDHGYQQRGAPWECYLDGPEVATPRTEVFFPCRQDESAAV